MSLNQPSDISTPLISTVLLTELIAYYWKFGVFVVYLSVVCMCVCEIGKPGSFVLLTDSKHIECAKYILRLGRVKTETRLYFLHVRWNRDNTAVSLLNSFGPDRLP